MRTVEDACPYKITFREERETTLAVSPLLTLSKFTHSGAYERPLMGDRFFKKATKNSKPSKHIIILFLCQTIGSYVVSFRYVPRSFSVSRIIYDHSVLFPGVRLSKGYISHKLGAFISHHAYVCAEIFLPLSANHQYRLHPRPNRSHELP